MRKLMILMTAAALIGGAAFAVQAATANGRTPLKCLDTVWRTTATSTSSTSFRTVPGFTDSPVAIYPIAINVSALVSGAPVEFRILSTNVGGQTHASQPGVTRFVPGTGANSFAYQWVERNQSAATHSNMLRLQWRSPSGNTVHLLRGDMSIAYTTDTCMGSP